MAIRSFVNNIRERRRENIKNEINVLEGNLFTLTKVDHLPISDRNVLNAHARIAMLRERLKKIEA